MRINNIKKNIRKKKKREREKEQKRKKRCACVSLEYKVSANVSAVGLKMQCILKFLFCGLHAIFFSRVIQPQKFCSLKNFLFVQRINIPEYLHILQISKNV